MLERLSRLMLALCCALVATMPTHAEVSPSEGGASLAKLDALYCELDGCDMTGSLTLEGGSSVLLRSGADKGSLTSGASGTDPVWLKGAGATSGALLLNSSIVIAGRQADFGDNTSLFCVGEDVDSTVPGQVLCVDGFGDLANPSSTNSGRVRIDDDAQVTGTLHATTVTRTGGDLTLSTTTSGDVVLAPAAGSGTATIANGADLVFDGLDGGVGGDIVMRTGNSIIRGDLSAESTIAAVYAGIVRTSAGADEDIAIGSVGNCEQAYSGMLYVLTTADSSALCVCLRSGASSWTGVAVTTQGASPPSC